MGAPCRLLAQLQLIGWLVGTGFGGLPMIGAASPPARTVPAAPTEVELCQRKFFEQNHYCHHILAVDADGNALVPQVTRTDGGSDKLPRYHADTVKLAGEDTRGARLDFAELVARGAEAAAAGKRYTPVTNEAMENVLAGRRQLYFYLEAMFRQIALERPDEIIVHVHGGLNNIHGAIAKTALIADRFELDRVDPPGGKRRLYYIGICWNSDLYPTYKDHLLSIREGLHQPGKAAVTAPAMLLSDLGSAVSRLPLNLINFLYQDAYTVSPESFKRTQLAQTRVEQIQARAADEQRRSEQGRPSRTRRPSPGLTVSPATDERTNAQRQANAVQWLVTQPAKVATTLFLDWLGTEPWRNMLRRTRTIFERESEFIPKLTYKHASELASYLSNSTGRPVDPDTLLDQMNSTGRTGAVYFFCHAAQNRLAGEGWRPQITLLGHSMGAIVSCEILQRFHRLSLDNVVFMGAACSVNDFKTKVVPYLQEQNLRENLHSEFARTYGIDPQLSAAKADRKTRFYNLCLHDAAENGEKNPLETDLVQRGSLLTWIDTLYGRPESENDRTLGRWINAILSTDNLPGDIVDRITIKEFGVDRRLENYPDLAAYAFRPGKLDFVQEPMHHGDFGRFQPGMKAEATNLAFWRAIYRQTEMAPEALVPVKTTRRSRSKVAGPAADLQKVRSLPASAVSRSSRTGF